jgi:hypothetical protein
MTRWGGNHPPSTSIAPLRSADSAFGVVTVLAFGCSTPKAPPPTTPTRGSEAERVCKPGAQRRALPGATPRPSSQGPGTAPTFSKRDPLRRPLVLRCAVATHDNPYPTPQIALISASAATRTPVAPPRVWIDDLGPRQAKSVSQDEVIRPSFQWVAGDGIGASHHRESAHQDHLAVAPQPTRFGRGICPHRFLASRLLNRFSKRARLRAFAGFTYGRLGAREMSKARASTGSVNPPALLLRGNVRLVARPLPQHIEEEFTP